MTTNARLATGRANGQHFIIPDLLDSIVVHDVQWMPFAKGGWAGSFVSHRYTLSEYDKQTNTAIYIYSDTWSW